MQIVLWGATGLVGSACLRYLLKDSRVDRVIAPTRRPLSISHVKLHNPVSDFSSVDDLRQAIAGATVGISTLGTTLRQAGSRDAFRAVDHDLNLAAARLGHAVGIQRWCLVSAVGASSDSLFFYNRVKGELEDALVAIRFPELVLFRPGLLLGHRQQFRLGESLASKGSVIMNALMVGPLTPFKAVSAERVGLALCHAATAPFGGSDPCVRICYHDDFVALAQH